MALMFKDFVAPDFEQSFLKVTKFHIEKETEKVKNFTASEKLKLARFEIKLKKEKELYTDFIKGLGEKYQPLVESMQKEFEASQDLVEKNNIQRNMNKLQKEIEDKVMDFQKQESELDIKLDYEIVSKVPAIDGHDMAMLMPVLVNLPADDVVA